MNTSLTLTETGSAAINITNSIFYKRFMFNAVLCLLITSCRWTSVRLWSWSEVMRCYFCRAWSDDFPLKQCRSWNTPRSSEMLRVKEHGQVLQLLVFIKSVQLLHQCNNKSSTLAFNETLLANIISLQYENGYGRFQFRTSLIEPRRHDTMFWIFKCLASYTTAKTWQTSARQRTPKTYTGP